MILSLEELDNKDYALSNTIEEKYNAIDQKLDSVGYSINNHNAETKDKLETINNHIDYTENKIINEIKDVDGYIDFIKPTIVQARRNTDHILNRLNIHLILLILLGVVSVSSLVFDIILLCLMG